MSSETESAERRARYGRAAEPLVAHLTGTDHIGPPPPGPLMCFYCVTGTCGHAAETKRSNVHGGGMVPAITIKKGTAVCLDCATHEPSGVIRWD